MSCWPPRPPAAAATSRTGSRADDAASAAAGRCGTDHRVLIHYPATHMSPVKDAVACELMALLISACGIPSKPVAVTAHLRHYAVFYGVVDDPRLPQVK